MSTWSSILLAAAAVYLGLLALVWIRQSSYVYFPDRVVRLTPAYFGLAFESFRVATADNEEIAGWFVPSDSGLSNGAATLVCCHGNGGNIGDRVDEIRALHELGFNVAVFDYRGYGESTGVPSEEGTYADAAAVWQYLLNGRGVDPARIVVYGRSLGGAVAVELAMKVKPAGLVVESCFTSAPDMAKRMFPLLPVGFVCRFKYDSLSRMSRVKCPVLVAHGPGDEMIPFKHGQSLFLAANEPSLFVTLQGLHNDSGLSSEPEARLKLQAFVNSSVKAARQQLTTGTGTVGR